MGGKGENNILPFLNIYTAPGRYIRAGGSVFVNVNICPAAIIFKKTIDKLKFICYN